MNLWIEFDSPHSTGAHAEVLFWFNRSGGGSFPEEPQYFGFVPLLLFTVEGKKSKIEFQIVTQKVASRGRLLLPRSRQLFLRRTEHEFKKRTSNCAVSQARNPYGPTPSRARWTTLKLSSQANQPVLESAWRSPLEAGGDRSLMTPKTTRAQKGSLRQAAGFGNEI